MKQETLFLKIAVFIMGLPILALSMAGVPWLINNPFNQIYGPFLYPIITGLYLSIIPFFIALYQAFKLLSYIDKNIAFSENSIKALKTIKYCALTISSFFVVLLPFVYIVAEKDDAPGLILVGFVPIFTSMVVAVFAAVLQKLLQNAIDIKSDNDLTI